MMRHGHRLLAILGGVFLLCACGKEDRHAEEKDRSLKKDAYHPARVPREAPASEAAPQPAAPISAGGGGATLELLKTGSASQLSAMEDQVRKLVKSNPDQVLHTVIGLPPGTKRDQLITTVALSLPAGHLKAFMESLRDSGFEEDKHKFGEFFGRMKDMPKSGDIERILVDEKDPAFGTALSRGLGCAIAMESRTQGGSLVFDNASVPPEIVKEVNSAIVERLSQSQPAKGVGLLVENWDLYSNGVRTQILGGLGLNNPDDAAPVVLANSTKYGYDSITRPFLDSWLVTDPMAASMWVSEMPDDATRDRGIAQVVKYLRKQGDTASADDWSRRIKDPALVPAN